MGWMALAAAAVSAGAGIYGSQQAGKTQAGGGKAAIREMQRQYDTNNALMAPWMQSGVAAQNVLNQLYGLPAVQYQPYATSGSIQVDGSNRRGRLPEGGPSRDPVTRTIDNTLGGKTRTQFGGTINPATGTVDVAHAGAGRDQILTDYLRTGEWTASGKGKKYKELRREIDKLRAGGYQYAPQEQPVSGTAPGTAGRFDSFFTSPQYNFVRDEGMRDVLYNVGGSRSPVGGSALKALANWNQKLASGEFQNWLSPLMSMAGHGQAATTNTAQFGTAASNNIAGMRQNVADSRASGIMGGVNSLASGVNSGLNAYYWNKYMQGRNQSGGAAYPWGDPVPGTYQWGS